MKIQKLIIFVLALAMVLSLGAFPAMADEPASENVIFICDGAEGDGSSAESPLKPTTGNYEPGAANPDRDKDAALYQAWEKLMALGGGTIVICGPYTLNDSNCQPIGGASADFRMTAIEHRPFINITYTSVWNGVDYRQTNGAELILDERAHITFPTGTVLENLTVRGTAANGEHFIAAGLNPLTLGKGTNFIPFEEGNLEAYPIVLGSFRSNAGALKDGDSNIIIDIGDENHIGNIFGMCNGGNGKHKGNTNITVKSGNIGNIYGDSRATSQVPQVGDINIRLEGGIYHGVIAGVNVGFTGSCAKTVNLTITGGDFSNCTGIMDSTTNADAVLPEVFNVDCSAATVEIARQVKAVACAAAKLTLPEGFTEEVQPTDPPADPTEPPADPTEGPSQPGGAEPAADYTWLLIVAIVVIVAAAVVIILVSRKKK